MKTPRVTFFIIASIIFLSLNSWAGDSAPICDKPSEIVRNSPNILLPAQLAGRHEAVISEIEKKNTIEVFNQDIKGVKYNDDGTIGSVVYDDGTVAQYTYTNGSDGKIEKCTISTDSVTVVVKGAGSKKHNAIDGDKQPEEGEGLMVEIYDNLNKEPDGGNGVKKDKDNESNPTTPPVKNEPAAKPIAVYHLKGDVTIEDIAKNPIKFDIKEVEGAISKAAALKSAAAKVYLDSTREYYIKVEKDLIKIGAIPGNANCISELERRRRIDNTIEEISRQAGKAASDKKYGELLSAERTLRGKLVVPAEEIYDDKVKKAQKYVSDMIDKLIASRIAVYLNVKKDKIDALINLPNEKK